MMTQLSAINVVGAALTAYLVWLLLRHPHLRRLALRSMRKQRHSTLLTIVGLAVSTSLIAMTLIANTALIEATDATVEKRYGSIAYDIASRNQSLADQSLFDRETVRHIRQKTNGDALPIAALPATYMTKDGQGEVARLLPYVHTIGVDAAEAIRFAPSSSQPLGRELQQDEVLLSSQAASLLAARVGDTVFVVDASNRERELRVSGIVPERGLTGYPGVYRANAAAIVTLHTARSLAGLEGEVYTNLLLTSLPPLGWIGEPVREIYEAELKDAIRYITILVGTASLNAILIGIVLVTNIFRLIAEERRGELGLLRAIGLGKQDVRRLLMIEGLLYGVLSGLTGVAIGWLLARVLIAQITSIFGGALFTGVQPHLVADPVHALSSLSIGMLVIGLCVTVISSRAVKSSVVDSMQPSSPVHRAKKRHPVWTAWLCILSCLLLLTLTALFTVPEFRRDWISADRMPLLIAAIFLSVPVTVSVAVQLLPLIGRGVLYGLRGMAVPLLVMRLALRNLNTNPVRTGLLLFMFAAVSCFISFSILYGEAMKQAVGHSDPIALTGGHDLAARDWRPLDTASVIRQMQASEAYDDIEPFQAAAIQQLVWREERTSWGTFRLMANGIDASFAETNDIPLLARDDRFASDREAWRELAKNEGAVILAADIRRYIYGEQYEIGGQFPLRIGDRVIPLTVIAIAGKSGYHPESYGIWTHAQALAELAKSEHELRSTVFIKLSDRADRDSVAAIERLLALQNVYPVTHIVDSENSYYFSLFSVSNLTQIFNNAALGIAMLGLTVVMYRLVRQRSRQIGVMRAIGIAPGTVLLSLLLEGFLVGCLGIALGTAAGTAVSYVSLHALYNQEHGAFALPAAELLLHLLAAFALALALSYLPARKALQVSPTEATRFTN